MDKTFTARKAKLLQQLQCIVCLGGVKDARLCPHCSGLFCSKCIHYWLNSKSASCPNCRVAVRYENLVNGRSINEVQESITQLVGCMDGNLCDGHKQHLTLYCYSCEVNLCSNCLYSPDHAEHKERVVPLDEAYEHYRKTLKTELVWVNGRKGLIQKALKQVAENQEQLNSEDDQIEKLCDEAEQLVAGEASSAALTNIRNIVGEITELRSERQRGIEAIRIDRRGDFMLEPTVLVFCMPDFSTDEKHANEIKDPNGFAWECTVEMAANDYVESESEDEEEDIANVEEEKYSCFLGLIEGKPSEYSVTFNNHPEQVLYFELNEPMMIGQFKPDLDNDTCRVTVEIRQTYADRFQQMQDRIEQLEKQCAKQKSLRNFLSEFEKCMGPSSG